MPSPRTNTTSQSIFGRPFPTAVTYDLSVPNQATITLPPGSTWTSDLHWHDAHTEYLLVLRGRARITLAGTVLPAVSPADGPITIPRGTVHEWRRCCEPAVGGLHECALDELVVREWTEPADGQKELFFRNLMGVVGDALRDGEGSWRMRVLDVELGLIFWSLDNWPVMLPGSWPGWVHRVVTRGMLAGTRALGLVLGCKGVYEKYTPPSLRA